MMTDGTVVWGAVGFRNQVADSPDDKKWARKKFRDDLKAAKQENPQLSAFVFFTNIDLRPSDVRSLRTSAATKGMSHCEIFYRERIRQVLDSVQGMPYRLQYLNLQMSTEEQLSFFNAFGSDLRLLLEKQHSSIDERLNVLDFWLACARPLRQFWIIALLDRAYSFEEIGHFRFALKLGHSVSHPMIVVRGRDQVMRVKSKTGQVNSSFSTETFIRGEAGEGPFWFRPTIFSGRQTRLVFRANLFATKLVTQLDDLNHMVFDFSATRSLTDHATSILIVGNRYTLADLKNYSLQQMMRPEPVVDWPDRLSEKEREMPLLLYGVGEINFDREAPRKYALTLEDRQYLLS
jgi:hypothetical protein